MSARRLTAYALTAGAILSIVMLALLLTGCAAHEVARCLAGAACHFN